MTPLPHHAPTDWKGLAIAALSIILLAQYALLAKARSLLRENKGATIYVASQPLALHSIELYNLDPDAPRIPYCIGQIKIEKWRPQ